MDGVDNALFGADDSFISVHDDASFLAKKRYVFDENASQAEEVAGSVAEEELKEDASAIYEKKVDALPKGKGRTSQTKCAQAFQLTLNEVEKWEPLKVYLLSNKNLRYMLAAKEIAPETKHEHIHCYVQFTRTVRFSIAKLQGAHIEACKGSAQSNIEYLKKPAKLDKDGNVLVPASEIIFERGTPAKKGAPTIKELKKMSAADREELPANYFNIVQKVSTEEAYDIDVDELGKEVKVFYFYGASGAGKTVLAKKWIKERYAGEKMNMLKYEGTFWHGVGSAQVALYDDFRDSHMPASEFINFIDYNVHPLNVKGGSKPNRYKCIFITSVQDPRWIYANAKNADESLKQWLRRMRIFKIIENPKDPLDPSAEEIPYEENAKLRAAAAEEEKAAVKGEDENDIEI